MGSHKSNQTPQKLMQGVWLEVKDLTISSHDGGIAADLHQLAPDLRQLKVLFYSTWQCTDTTHPSLSEVQIQSTSLWTF